jgi:hypothetical protein
MTDTPDRIRLTFHKDEIAELKELQDLLGRSFFQITKAAITAYKRQLISGGTPDARQTLEQHQQGL